MKWLIVTCVLFITGCSLSLDEVKTREAACKAEGGEVKRVMSGNVVMTIRCVVDNVEYWVAPSGALK